MKLDNALILLEARQID